MIWIGYKRREYGCRVYLYSLDDLFIYLPYVNDMLIDAMRGQQFKLKTLKRREFNMKDLGANKRLLGWRFTKTEILGFYGYLNIVMLRCYRDSAWIMQSQ